MQVLVVFINLFFPSIISIILFHNKSNIGKWTVNDLAGYVGFVLVNLVLSKLVMIVIREVLKYDFSLDGIEYTCIALVIGLLLPYGALTVKTSFQADVRIEKKK